MDENRTFKVELSIEAPDRDTADKLLDKMYSNLSQKEVIQIDCGDLKDTEERRYQERIRYVEDWNGHGEHFVFEGKWSDKDEWGLDSAFKLIDHEDKKGELISYQALTKIRELMKMDIDFWFSEQ